MNKKCVLANCFVSLGLIVLFSVTGCGRENPAGTDNQSADQGTVDKPDDGDGHPSHGASIDLGTSTIGDWAIRAGRDEGALAAGGEAAVDVWLTEGSGKISAVRFWIGTANAQGSIKALAAIENPAVPSQWHTHAEIPDPLPADCKLWVEVEEDSGTKNVASFDLKM